MKLVSILPADSYVVINKSLLNDNDRFILTTLYQPIIGSVSLSLYFTLWADLNKTEIMSNEYTHHHLMNIMGIKLDEIVSARKRLEAVGLLKTLYKSTSSSVIVKTIGSSLSNISILFIFGIKYKSPLPPNKISSTFSPSAIEIIFP